MEIFKDTIDPRKIRFIPPNGIEVERIIKVGDVDFAENGLDHILAARNFVGITHGTLYEDTPIAGLICRDYEISEVSESNSVVEIRYIFSNVGEDAASEDNDFINVTITTDEMQSESVFDGDGRRVVVKNPEDSSDEQKPHIPRYHPCTVVTGTRREKNNPAAKGYKHVATVNMNPFTLRWRNKKIFDAAIPYSVLCRSIRGQPEPNGVTWLVEYEFAKRLNPVNAIEQGLTPGANSDFVDYGWRDPAGYLNSQKDVHEDATISNEGIYMASPYLVLDWETSGLWDDGL